MVFNAIVRTELIDKYKTYHHMDNLGSRVEAASTEQESKALLESPEGIITGSVSAYRDQSQASLTLITEQATMTFNYRQHKRILKVHLPPRPPTHRTTGHIGKYDWDHQHPEILVTRGNYASTIETLWEFASGKQTTLEL